MNVEKLLQPEKLSDEELIRILASVSWYSVCLLIQKYLDFYNFFIRTFQLNIDVSISNPRSYLLDVYNRVALPLPQRPKNSKNGNAKLTNSTETNSTSQLDLLKSYVRFTPYFLHYFHFWLMYKFIIDWLRKYCLTVWNKSKFQSLIL